MQVMIDPDNGVPIYEQVVRQVKYAVAENVVLPGQPIPSVREMAKTLAINPNTVQRAYLQLQNDQVIEVLRGRGMVVSSGAKKICVSSRKSVVTNRIETVVVEAVQSGMEAEEIRHAFEAALSSARQRDKASDQES
ncbi:MAG: GntR family transcriptional regulator [Aureliella sp.]